MGTGLSLGRSASTATGYHAEVHEKGFCSDDGDDEVVAAADDAADDDSFPLSKGFSTAALPEEEALPYDAHTGAALRVGAP